MADKVKIEFVSTGAKSVVDDLTEIGKVEKKNADQFKKTNEENLSASKKRQDAIAKETALIQDLEKAKKKAFDPDSIRAYNDDIKRAKDNISVLKGETDKLDKSSGNFLGTLKNVGASLGIVFGTQQIIAFGKEAVMLAAKGEGIRTAFAKIGDEKALDKLRTATRGAVSDIELMSKALKAGDFKISTDLLAKGLEFAGKQAARTGQDVDYLVDSLVNGIGRKSTLVLDNLGISAVELQQEVKRLGGDFNQAVGNIINKRLEEMGEVSETTATKIAKLGAAWDNFKEDAGTAIIEAGERIAFLGGETVELGDDIASFMAKDHVKNFIDFIFGRDPAPVDRVQLTQEELKDLDQAILNFQNIQKNRGEETIEISQEVRDKILKNTVESHNKEAEIIKAVVPLTEEELEKLRKLREEEAKHKEEVLRKEIDDNAKLFDTLTKLRLDALKISNEAALLETEAGSDEELAVKIANIEKIRDFELEQTEFRDEQINIEAKAQNDILAIKLKYEDDFYREKAKNDEEEYKRQQKAKKENEDLLRDQTKARIQEEFDLALQLVDGLAQLNDQSTRYKLDSLNEQLEAGKINNAEFEKQEREIKRKAAGRDKLLSIFNIGLKTAEGVINYLSNPVTAPLVPFFVASSAIQLGLAVGKPLPFAKGTKSVPGQKKGVDSVHALLMPDEMVIPVGTKKKYEPILNSIFDEKISPDFLNALALKKDMKFDGSQRLSKYDIKEGMTAALRSGVYVKNMPDSNNGLTVEDLRFLTRRGLA